MENVSSNGLITKWQLLIIFIPHGLAMSQSGGEQLLKQNHSESLQGISGTGGYHSRKFSIESMIRKGSLGYGGPKAPF